MINNNVTLQTIGPIDELGDKEAMKITIEHDFNLSVPYVRAIFQDGEHSTAAGEGGYNTMSAVAYFNIEGIQDGMPAPPPIPRTNRSTR